MHPTIAQALKPFTPPAYTIEDLHARIKYLEEDVRLYEEALTYIYNGIEDHSIWHVNQVRGVCAGVLP